MPHLSDAPSPGVSAETLASISIPDRLDSVFGPMGFFDGLPLPDTVARSYDALDLLRGIDVFLNCLPGAAMVAMRRGLRSLGVDSRTIGYTAPRCGSAPLILTANTETTYGMAFLALDQDGPTVIEAPEGSLSVVDDLWQRYVADMGIAGPDAGKGGRYLFLPPGYDGDVPDGYFVSRSPTPSSPRSPPTTSRSSRRSTRSFRRSRPRRSTPSARDSSPRSASCPAAPSGRTTACARSSAPPRESGRASCGR